MNYHQFRFFFKGMDDWEDWKHSLAVWLNSSTLGTSYLLDYQFRDMPTSTIYAYRGSKYLPACMRMILKSLCRFSLWTCLIPSSMFFIFRFLIILPVTNIMFQDMVFRKPMALMCMRSHHRMNLLYLSMIPLGKFGTMIGSTCWILW